ncbi:MAG: gamma-glutamyl-gamma-aminobutyrate hydrolase family protein [Planctomycetota bacterium]|jgi:gamma-glutamyl-gamma-aminobutyrate hydrolase PuuD
MRPIIAINADWVAEPFEHARIRAPYLHAVEAAGGIPLLLPPTADPADAGALLARADGLLLSGGDDPDPALYGEVARPEIVPLLPRREAFDLELCRLAYARRIPTLAVCAGMQVLAISRGGSLHQHLPAQLPNALPHKAPDGAPKLVHDVMLTPGSRLAAAMGTTRAATVSHHHQAVRETGDGLRVVGRCPEDGVVEAIEAPGHPFCVGVQWHPERPEAGSQADRRLFEALVTWAAAHARRAA